MDKSLRLIKQDKQLRTLILTILLRYGVHFKILNKILTLIIVK